MTDDRISALVEAVDRNTAAIDRLKAALLEFIKVHEASFRALQQIRELEKLERSDPGVPR
jgi:hypothetical protein